MFGEKRGMLEDITPSRYQKKIITWASAGTGSAIVCAVAGSGKTRTILLVSNNLRKGAGKKPGICFTSYNKAIAVKLREVLPYNAPARTFHSIGRHLWLPHMSAKGQKKGVDSRKVADLTRKVLPSQAREVFGQPVRETVNFAKQRGIGCVVPDNDDEWMEVIEHFGVSVPYGGYSDMDYREASELLIDFSRRVLALSVLESADNIDFNDMIYMPLLRDLRPDKLFDWLLIDEAQDTNHTRRALAARLLKPEGRLAAVGDPRQAIYGFSGADSDAMDLIKEEYDCRVLPLSICYRSGQAIVRVARHFVPEMEAWDQAPEGEVRITSFDETPPGPDDVVLCRYNAPLIRLLYQRLARGESTYMPGYDVAAGLVHLVVMTRARTMDELFDRLDNYVALERSRLESRGQGLGKVDVLQDKVNCLRVIRDTLDRHDWVPSRLIARVKELLEQSSKEKRPSPVLTTIHKAKGLEWDRVFFYGPEVFPCPHAEQDWELEQEENLQYVAVTRARKSLFLVPINPERTSRFALQNEYGLDSRVS